MKSTNQGLFGSQSPSQFLTKQAILTSGIRNPSPSGATWPRQADIAAYQTCPKNKIAAHKCMCSKPKKEKHLKEKGEK